MTAHSGASVRVTMPAPVVASPTAKPKDPKKVAAGRAGAAARRARQESLLAELRAAKAAIAPAATPVADEAVTQSSCEATKQQEQPVTSATERRQQPMPAHADPGDPVKSDWTPWILVGAGLAALCVWHVVPMSRSLTPLVSVKQTVSGTRQQKQLHPETARGASSGARQPDGTSTTPRGAQQLKVTDPFHME